MGKRIYVGNLSFSVDDQQLEDLFAPFGAVDSAVVIIDRKMDRSKGFGFVEMATDEEAKAAIEALDGTEHSGRTLKVSEAKPRENRDGGRGGYGGGGGGGGYGGGGRDY